MRGAGLLPANVFVARQHGSSVQEVPRHVGLSAGFLSVPNQFRLYGIAETDSILNRRYCGTAECYNFAHGE